MSRFKPRTRNGQVIKNYIKRTDFVLPGCANGVKVPNASPGALEKSLKILKRQLKDTDMFGELRERRYFEKPSAKKRKQKQQAIRAQKKKERDRKRYEKLHPCWTVIRNGQAH